MLRNWRHLLEKHFSFLLPLLWVAFQWPFFMVHIFNIFPFLPSYFTPECSGSGPSGPEEVWATVVCLSLAPRPAGGGERVCVYIPSSPRAPCGANRGCLPCATGKSAARQIPGPPASPGDVCACARMCACMCACLCAICRRIVKLEACWLCPNPRFWNHFSVPNPGPVFTSFHTRLLCSVLLMKPCFSGKFFLSACPFHVNLSQLPHEAFESQTCPLQCAVPHVRASGFGEPVERRKPEVGTDCWVPPKSCCGSVVFQLFSVTHPFLLKLW